VLRHRRRAFAKVLRFVPPGWRNVPTSQRDEQFVLGGISHEHVDLETDGVQLRYWVQSYGDEHYVNTVDTQTRVDIPPRFARAEDAGAAVGPVAPLPGTVRAVLVEPGQRVTRGQPLVVLDAMKIEHRITAETDAEIAEVRVQAGDKVDAHQLLVVLHQ
jgi:propionyl-CoA carboxylase alpha chain